MYVSRSVVSFLNVVKSKRTVGVVRVHGAVFSKDISSVRPRSRLDWFKWGRMRRPRGGVSVGDFSERLAFFDF